MKKDPQRFIIVNALIAFACYGTSYVALSKALPPGYSTPLWPAAGIGIACALLYGFKAAPGIWLGAWALNFFHDEFWNNPTNLDLVLFQLSCVVATFSTIQAFFARFLTEKFLGLPVQFDNLRSIFFYFFLILPPSCLIASTCGSLALVAFEKSPMDYAGITWLTWWIGDLVGAALFSIVIFCFFAHPKKLWRPRRWLLGIPIAIMILSLIFLYYKTAGWQAERMKKHVQHHSIQLELELALIKRNSEVRWADFLDTLPDRDPLSALENPEFLLLLQKRYPLIQSLALTNSAGKVLFVWNRLRGPVDPFMALRKRTQTLLKPDETPIHHRFTSELFAINSSRLGILHRARIGPNPSDAIQVVAIADLTQDLATPLESHKNGGFSIAFGPKPSVQTQSIVNKNPIIVRSNNIYQQIAYTVSIPMAKVIENSSSEYIIVMIFSVVFTLTVLSLLLLSSGQSYHFERLFHERTEALNEQKIITEHASKLAALGEMAGSIAHEINNPLAIIQGYSEILQTKLKRGQYESGDITHGLNRIEQTCRRISAIIVSLRSYARNDSTSQVVSCSVREVVGETLELCREGLRDRDIQVEWETDRVPDISIIVNKAGLMQVLLNLIANARDAIAALPTRWIRISIEESQQGSAVSIRVSDSGHGIPKELQEKIMLPFFTTKPIGKGTGLGLSISRNLMQSMGGDLDLDRTDEHTSFLIRVKKEKPAEVSPRWGNHPACHLDRFHPQQQ
ncbi:MAG TPA: ATP-binding protein [Oligoflexus sp.]|uniref:ATP-binding protein n=1 Tax=Oligoflexus sp. TaxID=1971216 RepID=UPI002D80C514|nr:ATP-binding protein [Oligoflexus sp.]HET9241564.1 ATP-binding protein [Oligoflexus sp.]